MEQPGVGRISHTKLEAFCALQGRECWKELEKDLKKKKNKSLLHSGCYQQMKTTQESQSISVAKRGEGSAFRRRTGFSFVLTHRCAVGLLGAWAHFHDLREALFTEVILGRRKTCLSVCQASFPAPDFARLCS